MWRASQGNYNFLTGFLPKLKDQFGEDNSIFIEFSSLVSLMGKAIENGDNFIRQNAEDKQLTERTQSTDERPPLTKAKVLFLTDSSCGSACLDFADLIIQLPNVTHIGQETGADTVYMDIRYLQLPSGLGSYSPAQKVYRNRTRKHNESYVPECIYHGDINATIEVKAWSSTLTFPCQSQKSEHHAH